MEKVILHSIEAYDEGRLREVFRCSIEDAGFRLNGEKILLKPNLVMGKPPEKAVNTHPRFIAALVEILLEKGCAVSIGDSPGYETTRKALKSSGIMSVVEKYGLRTALFNGSVAMKTEGLSPYREFIFGENPHDYDLIINLPKLKTHSMMGLTLGVKNTFGFVSGLGKGKWHLRAGKDALLFASMIIDIHRLVNPALTILDGITGMDGDGPTSGRARPVGLVGVSRNAFALDRVVEKLVGAESPLAISRVAQEHGLIPPFEVTGAVPNPVRGFRIPGTVATDWGLPGYLKETLRKVLVKKPKVLAKKCKGCGICAKVCPAQAIGLKDDCPSFNYGACIRCYCCQEMCPEGAIRLR